MIEVLSPSGLFVAIVGVISLYPWRSLVLRLICFSQNIRYIKLIINAQKAKGREIKLYAFIFLMVLGLSDTRQAAYPWAKSQT